MRVSSPGRMAILRAGAFLTLLATWHFAPSSASAFCGDYVTSRADRESHTMHGGHGPTSHGAGSEQGSMAGQPPGSKLPCSGPTCSRKPLVPDAPIPNAPVQAEPWCDTTWLPRCAGLEPVADLFDHPLLWPPPIATLLARPPRPHSA